MKRINKFIKWISQKGIIILGLMMVIIIVSYTSAQNAIVAFPNHSSAKQNDSAYKKLQNFVDSLFETISVYDDWLYQRTEMSTGLESLKLRLKQLTDSLNHLNNFSLSDICAGIAEKKNEEKLKENLRNIFWAIEKCEKGMADVHPEIAGIESSLKDLENKLNKDEKNYKSSKNALQTVAENLEDPGKLQVKGTKYRFYIAHLNFDRIRIHNNPNSNRGQRLNDVMSRMAKQKEEAIMITNGGMYTPSFGPQGLLIENSTQITKLDTLKPANNLNFYMQPNGVFYTDSSGFYISTTDDFRLTRSKTQKMPLFATQSGPMLISNGKKNPNFKRGSTNYYIRSGVGLINQRKLVFIISDVPVNFYDFTTVFEEIFGCKNALYLDGAISEMYIDEKTSGFENPKKNNGTFGPVISISRIKK